jgi:membrane associated rhomboid family serine protease
MKWYYLLIGALIAGIICFAILKLVFHFDNNSSIQTSIAAAVGGFTAEYVRIYMMRKKMNRITKRRSE